MIFNGHTPESIEEIDEETIAEITVMWADGMLGGKGTFDALAPITAGVFNYLRSKDSAAYKPDQIFPWVVEYEQNPDLEPDEKDKVNNALLLFMSQAPGFAMEKFNGTGISS
jgi:hypothetical protein